MLPLSLLQLHPATIVASFVAGYVGLEWVTYVPAFSPLGIAPWNPAKGVLFALILLLGIRYAPLIVIAPVMADVLIRHAPLPIWVGAAEIGLSSVVYLFALMILGAPAMRFDRSLSSMRDLILLAGVAIVSAALVAMGYVGVLHQAGLLASVDVVPSIVRYWVGEVIGILVVTPFLLILFTNHRLPRFTLEFALQVLAILLAIGLVLGAPWQKQLFYVLFLPIVWIAVRTGLEGVTVGLMLIEVGLMIALHVWSQAALDVTAFQVVMLVLAFCGLAIGILISERERAETRVRLQQDDVSRAGRVASLGTFSTAIAHEINQPLTAIGNYARVAQVALEADPPALSDARGATAKVAAQVARAAEVIRRLRALLETGRAELLAQPVSAIMSEAVELIAPDVARGKVRLNVEIQRGLPDVLADRLQIEQVIVNLVRNAIEAMSATPGRIPAVSLSATAGPFGYVTIEVADSGPGFPPGFTLAGAAPGRTSKPHGLGIGLVLCRSIVEAHGGRIEIENEEAGARVRVQLRTVKGDTNDRRS